MSLPSTPPCPLHRRGHSVSDAKIEWLWNDIFGRKFIITDQIRDRHCGSNIHILTYLLSTHIKCTPKNTWKREHIVDLVWIIRASCAEYRNLRSFCRLIRDLRIRVRHRKYNR